jgi:hypothetical protein
MERNTATQRRSSSPPVHDATVDLDNGSRSPKKLSYWLSSLGCSGGSLGKDSDRPS